MDTEQLRAMQAPLKQKYREQPDAAQITLKAQGRIGEGITCKVDTGRAMVEAGLHPVTGVTGCPSVREICCWRPWWHAPA